MNGFDDELSVKERGGTVFHSRKYSVLADCYDACLLCCDL
jgi:hypothetical protein